MLTCNDQILKYSNNTFKQVEQKYSANDGSIAQTQSTVAETQGTSGKNQYTSQNHLESAGARSAVDIGFPNVDILQAIEKLRIQNKGM